MLTSSGVNRPGNLSLFWIERNEKGKAAIQQSLGVKKKIKKTSKYKHSLGESWWDIGFEGTWWCKKQGNKVLSEGKI